MTKTTNVAPAISENSSSFDYYKNLHLNGWEKTEDGSWVITIIMERVGKIWAGIFFDILEVELGKLVVGMQEFKIDHCGDYCLEQDYPAFFLESINLQKMIQPYLDRGVDLYDNAVT